MKARRFRDVPPAVRRCEKLAPFRISRRVTAVLRADAVELTAEPIRCHVTPPPFLYLCNAAPPEKVTQLVSSPFRHTVPILKAGALAPVAPMPDVQILMAVVLPVVMFAGGIAAWRATKKQNEAPEPSSTWRDDSLDDWRKERDAQAEERRLTRLREEQHISTGSEEQQETKKHHQRLGG